MTPERATDRVRTRLARRLQSVLRRAGYELNRYPPPIEDPALEESQWAVRLMASEGVDVVLDVGANTGQFAGRIREAGYSGAIVSFEPLGDACLGLRRRAAADPAWEVRRLALGDHDAQATEINVSRNSVSSSLLSMGARHLESAPESAYVGHETVPMAKLDSVWADLALRPSRPWLKLDLQGYEMHVLRGATRSLPKIRAIQAELSLVRLYEGATPWQDVVAWLGERRFVLAGVEPGYCDSHTGRMLQFDGIFLREELDADTRD